MRYCGACHGAQAKGDGIVSPFMRPTPPDLTTIAQRNGGTFPTEQVERTVDGREMLHAHGTPTMPVWGTILSENLGSRGTQRPGIERRVLGQSPRCRRVPANDPGEIAAEWRSSAFAPGGQAARRRTEKTPAPALRRRLTGARPIMLRARQDHRVCARAARGPRAGAGRALRRSSARRRPSAWCAATTPNATSRSTPVAQATPVRPHFRIAPNCPSHNVLKTGSVSPSATDVAFSDRPAGGA